MHHQMGTRLFLRGFLLLMLLVIWSIRLQAQGGNSCATSSASPISLPFFTNNQTLCGDNNDYNGSNACLSNTGWGNPYGGQDWLYTLIPTQDGLLTIVLNDIHSSGTAYPMLSFYEGCPGTGTCITSVQGNNSGATAVLQVNAGNSYYVLLDAYTVSNYYANCYQYDLTINLAPTVVQPACSNMGYEAGNLSSWTATSGESVTAPAGSVTPFYQMTGIGILAGRHTIMTGGTDPCAGFPRVDPLGGTRSVRLGNNNTGAEAEQITQTFLVGQSNSSFTYRYAVVFEDPGHTSAEQPFFIARLRDPNGDVIPCSEFIVSAAASLPGFFNSPTCAGVRYKPWSTVNVDLSNYLGQNVTVEFTAGDCSQGGHFGYAYVDAACAPSTLAGLTDTICPGESVVLTAPTGYSSYTWQPGAITTQTLTVSPVVTTNYTLNLTAFNGCVTSVQVPIIVSPIPVPVIQYQAPACDLPVQVQSQSSISSGAIVSQVWNLGGVANPTTSSQQTVNVTYPGPGSYPISLQLTSDQGCVASAIQTVIVPPCVFRIAISGDTICPGQCLSFPVSLAYGTAPYTYLWSNGSTNSTITLCSSQSSIVSLTVTDADGFSATDTAMITVAPEITFASVVSNVLCAGGSNGTIDPIAQGWGPFSYVWSNAQTSSTLSNLSAGAFTLTLTDRFGCQTDTAFTITQPAPLSITLTTQAATCAQNNGSIQVNLPSGGTAPYQYSIDGGVYSSFSQMNGVAPGLHSVSVQDANGCTFTVNATVNMLSYPTQLSMNLTNATCGFDNGVITPIQVTGGMAPFTVWVNGSNMGIVPMPITFDSLYPGAWNVELSDANGCLIDTNVTLLQIEGPGSLSFTTQAATCGLTNASISIGPVIGGTPAFTYSLNGGPFSSQTSYPNLTPGPATVVVQDQNQCQLDTVFTLALIPDVEISASLIQLVQCAGGSDGSAVGLISSGSAPFTFLWTNGETDSLATALQAGSWNVFVTDVYNCRDTAQITITQPLPLGLTILYENPHCALSNGAISVDTVSGGTAPYMYQLNGGQVQMGDAFSDLDVGPYTLQVVDAHGCSLAQQVQLAMPSYPTAVTVTVQDAVCADANGEARLTHIQGGIAPFQILWIDSIAQTITTLPIVHSGLDAGSYPIHVQDANGCVVESVAALQQFPGPQSVVIQMQPAICAQSNASVTLQSVEGGSPAYQYSFNNGPFGAQQQFSSLAPGNYPLAVRDIHGCLIDSSIVVTAIPSVQIAPFITHPITCFGYNDGALQADVNLGTAPYSVNWTNGPTGMNSENLVAGTYQVSVTDANGCIQMSSIVLNQPDPVVVNVTGPAYVCDGSEAELIAVASGGTSHISLVWPGFSHEGDTLVDTPVSSRTYTVIASDVLGCAASDSQSVLLRLRPQGTINTDVAEGCSPICVNFEVHSTGTALIQDFNWSFSNGAQGNNIIQKVCFTESGSQDVTVQLTDVFGCSNSISAEGAVNVFPLPQARFSYNPQNADILQPTYQFIQESLLANTYAWTFGDGQTSIEESPLHTYPDTGQYTACLRVTTNHGCTDQICKKVEIDPFPTIFAPNAFTPNGDGTNEVFMIRVTYAKKFLLEIFNRWGELIYEGSDPLEGWDGTYLGNRVQEDVYVWRATVTNSLNKSQKLIGRVSIID